MKLLILTQAVDLDDNVLSFFHRWIEEFAPYYEKISVICLKEGRHVLPTNVQVYSLGKESGASRFKYITRFYRYIWKLRKEYDTVFIHMNEEYGILGGWLWRVMAKKVTMWRNHHAGSFRTDIAVFFCNAVFCTSKFSYTARFKKTILMPVGVDTDRFTPEKGGAPQARRAADSRVPGSILFFSGMWQTKRPEMLLDALALLTKKGISYTADFYGSPLPDGQAYYKSVQKRAVDNGISDFVKFYPGVPNDQAPALFRAHEIFVNCSQSGMFDKMLFEAAACGCRVLASSEDFAALAHDPSTHFRTTEELAHCLEVTLPKPPQSNIPEYVAANSLDSLAVRLTEALYLLHA
jgi:glycosyltransferase involved in cell wall biosynthesis